MDRCRSFFLLIMLVLWQPGLADDRDKAQAELDAVRERIQALQAELRQEGRRRTRAEKQLRETETAEQEARRRLQDLQRQSLAATGRRAELVAQERAQQAALQAQRDALAGQLRMAYINGDEEWLRVALSQQQSAMLGRRMVYYGYLSRQRQTAIKQLRQALEAIAATRQQIQDQIQRLAELEAAAADQLEDIANTRADRARVVKRIRAAMETRDQEIAALRSQESELGELVAALARRLPAMPDVDAEPFAGQAASLEWPVNGPLLKKFGQARADGSLRWNGVLLGAPAGSEVRAVYHGRVVFSDWLAGMGLLTIVEHDGGYMSLYGHNQDLLKEVGEWVAPGEAIAHVGDSGGQANAGLYFEIRKDGQPVDPRNWVK